MKVNYVSQSLMSPEGVDMATIEDCVAFMKRHEVLGLDIETSGNGKHTGRGTTYQPGLDPRLSRVVMLQIGSEEEVFVIDTRSTNITPILPYLTDPTKLFVGHNLGFEYQHLLHNYGIRLERIWDTMICEMNLRNGERVRFDLASTYSRYYDTINADEIDLFTQGEYKGRSDNGFATWVWKEAERVLIDKSTRLGFKSIGDAPFTVKQILYGVDDIVFPLRIYERQLEGREVKGEIYNPSRLHALENQMVKVLGELSYQGMPFDKSLWVGIYERSIPIYYYRKEKLDAWVVDNVPEFVSGIDMFTQKPQCVVDWNSPAQVVNLFKHLGFCPRAYSKQKKTEEWTVGAVELEKLLSGTYRDAYEAGEEIPITGHQPLIVAYLQFSEIKKQITTYGKDYLKYVHPLSGRIHPRYFQILSTGRMSSSSPNLQQLPQEGGYRECFRSKGEEFAMCDYSSQEVRVLAHVSAVQLMKDFFVKEDPVYNGDFHSFVATQIERAKTKNPEAIVTKKSAPDKRQDAKSVTFTLAYGGGAQGAAAKKGVPVEEMETLFQDYFDSFPGLEDNFTERKKLAVSNGYIDIDPFGRRWFHPYQDDMNTALQKALALYPSDYRTWTEGRKAEFKAKLYKSRPEVKEYWKVVGRLRAALERKALNYPIQGTAASMVKAAAILFYQKVKAAGALDVTKIINIIHDEIVITAPPHLIDGAVEVLVECMVKAGEIFCPDLPMLVEVDKSNYWKK